MQEEEQEKQEKRELERIPPKPMEPLEITKQAYRLLVDRLMRDFDESPGKVLKQMEDISRIHRELAAVCAGASPRGRSRDGVVLGSLSVTSGGAGGQPPAVGDLTSSLVEQGTELFRAYVEEKQKDREAHQKRVKERSYQTTLQMAEAAYAAGDTERADRLEKHALNMRRGDAKEPEESEPMSLPVIPRAAPNTSGDEEDPMIRGGA
jgi:hypothetical protein